MSSEYNNCYQVRDNVHIYVQWLWPTILLQWHRHQMYEGTLNSVGPNWLYKNVLCKAENMPTHFCRIILHYYKLWTWALLTYTTGGCAFLHHFSFISSHTYTNMTYFSHLVN